MLDMKNSFLQLLVGLSVLLLAAVLLKQQIITTIFWYKVAGEVQDTAAIAITPQEAVRTLHSDTDASYEQYSFYDLTVPLIFSSGRIKEDSSTVLAMVDTSTTKAYSLWRGAKLAHEFQIDQRRTNTEVHIVCGTRMTQTFHCDDNYLFLSNTLLVTTEDAGLFSSQETKIRTAMYLLMKHEYVDAETSRIVSLELNDTFIGYLLYAGSTATALIFEKNNHQQPFQFVFSNITTEEIETVLANTNYTQRSTAE